MRNYLAQFKVNPFLLVFCILFINKWDVNFEKKLVGWNLYFVAGVKLLALFILSVILVVIPVIVGLAQGDECKGNSLIYILSGKEMLCLLISP